MNLGALVRVVDDLRWIGDRAAKGGPIRTLLRGAADELEHAVELLHSGCCPNCGGRSRRWYTNNDAHAVDVIRQSFIEGLIDEADVFRLLGKEPVPEKEADVVPIRHLRVLETA